MNIDGNTEKTTISVYKPIVERFKAIQATYGTMSHGFLINAVLEYLADGPEEDVLKIWHESKFKGDL